MSILVLTSDTLIGTAAAGNIEYNGQFFGTDSNASRAQLQRIVQGTAVASTSGTSINFTGIPSWVKRITVMFNGVSTSSTSNPIIQIGSGSIVTTGYNGQASSGGTGLGVVTTGFPMWTNVASTTVMGNFVLVSFGSNIWSGTGIFPQVNTTGAVNLSGGISPALSGSLDRIRITTLGGTDTFDAGTINIMYEG